MGNKFCKVENDYIISAQKSFANCVTDKSYEDAKEGRNPPREEGPEENGRCMYYNTDALSKVDMSKMSDEEKSPIFLNNMVDTGMKCTMKSIKPMEYTVTTSGSVPSNMYRIKSKPSTSQQSINEFEAKYLMAYGAAMSGDSASRAELEKQIDAYFDTSILNTPSAPSASSTQTTPTTQALPASSTDYAHIDKLVASIFWWTMAILVVVIILLLVIGLIRWIVGTQSGVSTPIQQYGGAKTIKKILKKVK